MSPHPRRTVWFAVASWMVAFFALACLARQASDPPPGWDLRVYAHAMDSLARGRDPYADGIAAQQAYHRLLLQHPGLQQIPCVSPPCTYVYSPLTLPPLRALARLPRRFVLGSYVLLLALGTLASSLALGIALEPGTERTLFALILPGVLFYPGLVLDFVILSGNLVYLLYGLVFSAAVLGWKRHRWLPFYLAVTVASCFKAPLLSLLAIPVLSEDRAWRPVCLTALCALALFFAQPLLRPTLFHHYLEAVGLQFSYNQDFGVGPAGLLSSLLTHFGHSYSPWAALAYGACATTVALCLLPLRARYLAGELPRTQWLPVLLLGTLLLNPRIKEYDIAAFTLPMALVLWRLCTRNHTLWRAAAAALLSLVALEAAATTAWLTMRGTYGLLLVGLIASGVWLLHRARAASAQVPASPSRALRTFLPG